MDNVMQLGLHTSLVRRCNTPTSHSHEPPLHTHMQRISICEDDHAFFEVSAPQCISYEAHPRLKIRNI